MNRFNPHDRWMTMASAIVLWTLLPWLGGCDNDDNNNPANLEVSGTVAAGVVGGATVASFAINNGHVADTPFATAVTDATGRYQVNIPEIRPFVVEARNGNYQDEATGGNRSLDVPLRAAATAGESPLNITPFSEAAVRYAVQRGDLSEAGIEDAQRLATHYLLDVDPLTTAPLDPTNAPAMAKAAGPEKMLAVALGALSQEMMDRGTTLEAVVEQIAEGLSTGGAWLSSAGGGYIEDQNHPNHMPTDQFSSDIGEGFTSAFSHFVSGNRNASGVSHADDLIFSATRSSAVVGTCDDSTLTSDFASRDKLPQSVAPDWQTTAKAGPWGPHPASYPTVSIPAGCEALRWQQQRVLAVIDKYVKAELNYCHHHIPGWLPPDDSSQSKPKFRVSTPGNTMTCTANRKDTSGNIVWQGMDCSNFTSWVYNYALGIPNGGKVMTGAIGQQACDSSVAPGVALDYNYTNIAEVIAAGKLQPGDLLYIMGGGGNLQITHVITWIGQQVGVGFDQSQLAPDASSYIGEGQSLTGAWVIADSHYNGPDYRPFLGWYQGSISHVRRVLGADQVPAGDVLNTTDPAKFTIQTVNKKYTCTRVSF